MDDFERIQYAQTNAAECLKTARTCFRLGRSIIDPEEARDMIAKSAAAASIGLLITKLPASAWVEEDC
jgi:hypothetical protein